jgi:ABC-type multidrug transport system, ATPase component
MCLPVIQTHQLNYTFGKGQPVLHHLNLQVPVHSIYGILGPNGVGKTTTLRRLPGLLKNQQGDITVFMYSTIWVAAIMTLSFWDTIHRSEKG